MVWFLLMETETVPMGWAPYEPMMPAAQGLDTRSWLGGHSFRHLLGYADTGNRLIRR